MEIASQSKGLEKDLEPQSCLDDFKFLKRIGEGAYSSVWKVKRM